MTARSPQPRPQGHHRSSRAKKTGRVALGQPDEEVTPNPGDFLCARNGQESATDSGRRYLIEKPT